MKVLSKANNYINNKITIEYFFFTNLQTAAIVPTLNRTAKAAEDILATAHP